MSALPFSVQGTIGPRPVKFRIMTYNFNNAVFYEKAGYDKEDFRQRIDRLAKLMEYFAKEHVVLFNIQELSSRYMDTDKIRNIILKRLKKVNIAWTATPPMSRHGDHAKCLQLMTFWNANILHLNRMINHHYSEGESRDVGDKLCGDLGIFATGNALIMDMSLHVPAIDGEYHTTGLSIDNEAKILNVNTHLPMKGPLKVRCLEQLYAYINKIESIDDYFVSISGTMNVFFDEAESKSMIQGMETFGTIGASPCTDSGSYSYPTYDGMETRETTFVGMKYDIKNIMKLFDPDIEPEKFKLWIDGQASIIKKEFGRDVGPLDWFIFKNRPWCQSINTCVLSIQNIVTLLHDDFEHWLNGNNMVPDYGNFISDNLPLMTTIVFDNSKRESYLLHM